MISVFTPSVRPELLPILAKCLRRQTITDWEWIIAVPERLREPISDALRGTEFTFVAEPPKREGDYYRLCGAWNAGLQACRGELIVAIMDGLWFPPETLQKYWIHYQQNPKSLITAIGHQYNQIDEYGKPVNMVWQDPRQRDDQGTFYEVAPSEMEMCVASLPKQAILDCGGMDEDYDRGAAVGEKEMCWRLDKLGYRFFIDQTIEYRAIQHPRLTKDWDEKYKISSALFIDHMTQLSQGKRTLNVGYIR